MQKACSPLCALELVKQGKAKQARADKRAHNRQDRSWQLARTQEAFNRMRKSEEMLWFYERGLEPECISCGRPNMDWCCGHFKTRGAHPELRFDRKNTFLQCNWRCNKNLSGNIEGSKNTRGYKRGLVERFGEGEGQAIIDYCETYSGRADWSCEELETMRAEFARIDRETRKQLKRYGVE